MGLTPSEIFLELVSKDRAQSDTRSKAFRMRVCRDLVGNTICADLLDYLHRDWYHLGKPRMFDDRLLDYLEVRQNIDDDSDSRLVVNLREGAEVRLDAVTAIFELLENRYQLGEVALFHRKKLTASAMLERLVAEVSDTAEDQAWFQSQIDDLLEVSDEEMLTLLVTLGNQLREGLPQGDRRRRLDSALDLARSLRYRQLHQRVVAFKSYELAGAAFVKDKLGGVNGASNRLAACRSLEEDFQLPAGSVVIYCPDRTPHAKIARVQVLINGRVGALADLEHEGTDPAMTNGLLEAQQKRFEGLWRVQVALSPAAIASLRERNVFSDFERAVECLVLKAHRGSSDPETIARELARKLLANPDFDTNGKVLVAAGEMHGHRRTIKTYPSGASTLSSLFVQE